MLTVSYSKVRIIQIFAGVLASLTCTDRSHGLKRPVLASRF
jgi:hypothetical protein